MLAGATVVMAGLMFCSLYALTGRLWVPIGLHLAWNFAQGYLFGANVSGNNLGGCRLGVGCGSRDLPSRSRSSGGVGSPA